MTNKMCVLCIEFLNRAVRIRIEEVRIHFCCCDPAVAKLALHQAKVPATGFVKMAGIGVAGVVN